MQYTDKMQFLQLPVEIRLNVYSQLFGEGITKACGGRQDVGSEANAPNMLPVLKMSSQTGGRGAQLLRTCKVILNEARPVLYKSTVFQSSYQAFAGKLPNQTANDNLTFQHVKHLEWQLNCDLLKKHEPADVHIDHTDVQNLQSVQMTCQVDNWRDVFCEEWYNQGAFVRGRQQFVDFAKLLQSSMSNGKRMITLVEDTKHLSRGRVVLKLFEGRRSITSDVSSLQLIHQMAKG